jgi:hypothetical protein
METFEKYELVKKEFGEQKAVVFITYLGMVSLGARCSGEYVEEKILNVFNLMFRDFSVDFMEDINYAIFLYKKDHSYCMPEKRLSEHIKENRARNAALKQQ